MEKELNIKYRFYSGKNELSTEDQQLFEAALAARKNSYSPYSNFAVGCALLLSNGQIVSGSNQENAAFPSGLCAERTALFWAAANFPDQIIKKMFVTGAPTNGAAAPATPPCGSCRQSILEYESKQQEPISIYFSAPDGEIFEISAVRDLLPFSFDGSFL